MPKPLHLKTFCKKKEKKIREQQMRKLAKHRETTKTPHTQTKGETKTFDPRDA